MGGKLRVSVLFCALMRGKVTGLVIQITCSCVRGNNKTWLYCAGRKSLSNYYKALLSNQAHAQHHKFPSFSTIRELVNPT